MQPITIQADQAGKRFGREWVFRQFTGQFISGQSYALLGQNGSGKSTLLLALSGYYRLSKGTIQWAHDGVKLAEDKVYPYYTLISPLLSLPEELTVLEFWKKHFALKPLKADWSLNRMFEVSGLHHAQNKYLKQLSSGMLQRVKLMAAFAADVPVVFLDEPCTNLDQAGIDMYQACIASCSDQLLIVASNMSAEYAFAQHHIQLEDFKLSS